MWSKIKILVWKSLQYRKKFWLSTIIEITIPYLIFIFLNYLITSKKAYDPTYDYNKSVFYTEALPILLPSATAISFLLMCSLTIKRIVNEKYSGMKELMKMMGLGSWMIWTGWILHNLFINTISITIILYILHYGGGHILVHSNLFLIWVFFIMYTIAGTFFCFAISSLFNQPLLALITGVIIWVPTYSLPLFEYKSSSFRYNLINKFSILFPNSAMTRAFITIMDLEYNKIGLQFSSLFSPVKNDEREYENSSVGLVFFVFVFQCFLYGFIAWYLDLVMPGKYGSAKPFNFLFKWSKKEAENYDMTQWNESNSILFEDPPNGFEVGISVQYLHKYFGNFHAVNGINLDFYKGQITALLGHNGAGKTTTMSIITGLFSPSYGNVQFNGRDIFSNIEQYRKHLGLCPQHNLHFSYLTTLNHLIFFGMLKGMTLENAKSEGLYLLKLLNILHKKDNLVNELSGGMKRKVSLAIALVGSPEILILDEPTSGMDTESRRQMWDLILSLRGSKTILITTHFMEEADVLGDRIAIMDHGKVKCYGTSLFLKKAYGTGYNLTIVKEQPCDESKIMAEIKKIIPEVKIQSSITSQVIINIIYEYTDRLPDLLRMLEKKKKEFSIKGMGIACSTLEEVFLRAEKNIQFEIDRLSSIHTSIDMDSYQLIIKKEIDCNIDQVTKLIQQYVPHCSLMLDTETQTTYNLPAVKKNVHEYGYLMSVLEIEKHNLKLNSCRITSQKLNDIYPKLLKTSDDRDKPEEPPICMPTLLPNKSSKIDLMINQFEILIQKKIIYTYRRWRMTLIIGILPVLFGIFLTDSYRGEEWINFIFFNPSLLYYQGYCIALPFNERVSGIKHLQLMTKLSPIMYWTTCFIWDYFCYTTIIIVTLVFMYLFIGYNLHTDPNSLYVLLALLLIFGCSGIIYTYVFSFFMKTYVGCMVLYIIVNLILFSTAGICIFLNILWDSNIIPLAKYIFLIIPYSSFSITMYGFFEIRSQNILRRKNNNDKLLSYFVFKSEENENGILEETLYLLSSFILYTVLILFFEYKIFERLYHFGFNKTRDIYSIDINDSEDPDIDNERHKVYAIKKHLGDTQSPIFVVDNLVKKFSSEFTGVRGISFIVSRGECFGLLGVNGAGKTTTFRILTGDIFPSEGNAFIRTDKLHNLNSDTRQFVSMIGYCPQFDALNDKLTGKETLKLMAILRGILPKDTKRHVDNWITLMGLKECKDRPSGTYSGGNKRKLSTAMALIGDPPVVFLDEPTSGVDPVSRRNLWKLLTSNRRSGQTIILTSHSMDECEALCNRLTIMVDGMMKCIGNVQYLKNRYGQGYTVMVKLSNNYTMGVADLKADIERRFSPDIHLKDEHRGLLHYHITNPHKPLSDIFDQMKWIKENYTSVEDYMVCDTTLEQVFIAFAKRQAILNTNV